MATVNLPPLTYTFGPYRLDHETGQLHHGDRIVSLQPRPLAVLRVLLEAGGSLVTKEDLIDKVWNGAFIEDSNITKCVAEIRQALRLGFRGVDPVLTVWKQGYRFVVPVEISAANPTPAMVEKPVEEPRPLFAAPAQAALAQTKFRVPRVAVILAAAGLLIVTALLVRLPKVMSKPVSPPASAVRDIPNLSPQAPSAIPERPSVAPESPSVALLGIRNGSSDRTADWIALILMETLTGELHASRNLQAALRSQVARVERGMDLDAIAPIDPVSLREAASRLDAKIAITGVYLVSGKNIQLDLRLTDARTGAVRASVRQAGSQDGLLELISRTGTALRRALGQDDSLVASNAHQHPSSEALHMYADGLGRLHQHDGHGATILLCRAQKLAPDYTPILRSLERIHRPGTNPGEEKAARKSDDARAATLCPPDDGRDLPPVHAAPGRPKRSPPQRRHDSGD